MRSIRCENIKCFSNLNHGQVNVHLQVWQQRVMKIASNRRVTDVLQYMNLPKPGVVLARRPQQKLVTPRRLWTSSYCPSVPHH